MAFWPLYRESLLQGPSHVSLALPGIPSEISKGIGSESQALLLVPNLDFLGKFIQGDIGIGDTAIKAFLQSQINTLGSLLPKTPPIPPVPTPPNIEIPKPPAVPTPPNLPNTGKAGQSVTGAAAEAANAAEKAAKATDKLNNVQVPKLPSMEKYDEKVIKAMAESFSMNIPDISKLRDASGKIKVQLPDVTVPFAFNDLGIKSIEKATLQSIFETQKPYVEIIKTILNALVSIEDIIARVMPLLALNPLTSKSEKPIVNGGGEKRTKSIGFQNGVDFKKVLAELDAITKSGNDIQIDKDGNFKISKKPKPANVKSGLSESSLGEKVSNYTLYSVRYSTGVFDPSIDYKFEYIYIPADEFPSAEFAPAQAEADNPYDKYKPKRIILGLFKSDGTPLNPKEKIKTITVNGNTVGLAESKYNVADWVYKSNKWKFRGDDYIWPSFGEGSTEPIFVWEGPLGITKRSKTSPGEKYSIKKYEKGDKNLINTDLDAVVGDPVIARFDAADVTEFLNYFGDFIDSKTKTTKELTEAEKKELKRDILSKLDVQSHLQNVYLYGSGRVSVYKPALPKLMNKSFKPYQIINEEAANDPNLPGDGLIWVDPEADYDLKVIRIDPTTLVDYTNPKGEPVVSAQVRSFVKNKTVFTVKGVEKFNVELKKNGALQETKTSVSQYILENWNYESSSRSVSLTNEYSISLWSKSPTGRISELIGGSTKFKMSQANSLTKHGDYEIEITKKGDDWHYAELQNGNTRAFTDGVKKLGDGSLVSVINKKIDKWFITFNLKLTLTDLPSFGTEKQFVMDPSSPKEDLGVVTGTTILGYSQANYTSTTTKLPQNQVKVSGKTEDIIITADAIDNDFLAADKLFSEGFYGNGTEESPQTVGVIKRFAKTEIDTESYYLIEGVLLGESKKADASGDDGSRWYRLPHAIGAIIPFLKFLVDLGMKLFPNIAKFLKLMKDPTAFITDIIKDKVGEAFSILSEEAFDKFKRTKEIMDKRQETIEKFGKSGYVDDIKKNFDASPLNNHVAVDRFNLKRPGDFKFIFDGTAMIPFDIFGVSMPFGLEFKMSNLVPKLPDFQMPEIPKPPTISTPNIDVSASTNLSTGASLNAGVNVPKAPSASDIKAPSFNTPDMKFEVSSPFKLIKGKFGKAKTKGCGEPDTPTSESGLDNSDALAQTANQKVDTKPSNKTTNGNTYQISSIWYSTGQFVNGLDYTYTYVTEDQAAVLKEVDELINPGSTAILNAPDSKIIPDPDKKNVSDMDLLAAKEKLEAELRKDPDNQALKNKLKEVMDMIQKRLLGSQPVLKFVLGMVASPLKIIVCIVQWILDFFKSLLNPVMLPPKMIEFLSFEWIMKFFSPKGILGAFGINFDPSIAKEWASLAKMPNLNLPCVGGVPSGSGLAGALPNVNLPKPEIPKFDSKILKVGDTVNIPGDITGDKLKGLGEKVKVPEVKVPNIGLNGGLPFNKEDLLKNIKPHCGKFALPDNFMLADINKFISIAFLPTLPTYTSLDIRNNPMMPFDFLKPSLCLIEKLINGFIDMVWSLLGIEVLIKAPHLKLCPVKSPTEKNNLMDNKNESDTPDATEITSTNPFTQKPSDEMFVYEVTFDNGEKKTFKNYTELQEFMSQNDSINFNLQI